MLSVPVFPAQDPQCVVCQRALLGRDSSNCLADKVDRFAELRGWLFYMERRPPWSIWIRVGEQGLNTLGSMGQSLCQRLCPACEDCEFISLQYARG